MKKVAGVQSIFAVVVVLLLTISFVSATNHGGSAFSNLAGGFGDTIISIFGFLSPVFEFLLGPEFKETSQTQFRDALLSNIMIFLVIFCVIFMTAGNMPFLDENQFVRWVVTIAVTVLATRWLVNDTTGWVQAVLLPYSVFGISVAAFVPFAVIFCFIEFGLQHSSFMRKIAWIFYIVVGVLFWFTRVGELTLIAASIYPITIVLSILFLLLDGTIQRQLRAMKLSKAKSKHQVILVEKLQEQYDRCEGIYEKAIARGNRLRANTMKRRMDELSKEIIKYSVH